MIEIALTFVEIVLLLSLLFCITSLVIEVVDYVAPRKGR